MVAVAVCAVGLNGCGDGSEILPQVAPMPVVTSVAAWEGEPHELVVSVLEDGVVTDSEMELALRAVIACARAGGADAELHEFRPGDGWSLGTAAGSLESDDQADAVLQECYLRIAGPVSGLYLRPGEG